MMRAASFYGPGDLRIEEIDLPEVRPGEVKVRNAYAGLCGSDVHMYFAPKEALSFFETPHPLTGDAVPQILGHEFSGSIVAVGDGAAGVEVGDEVTIYPVHSCGRCAACGAGRPNACRIVAFHGVNARGGGLAEYTTVAADRVHVLPKSVGLRMGAVVEPMAVGWHAVEISGIRAGEAALVIGAGPIGIGVWFALRAHGVNQVLVSEPNPNRRSTIENLGAHTLNPTTDDLQARVEDMTGGAGVVGAFDAAGAAAPVSSTLTALAPGGRLVIVATHFSPVSLNLSALVSPEAQIIGSSAYLPEDFESVIAAMAAGHYDLTGWVEDRRLEEAQVTLNDLHEGRGAKILLRPGR